MYPYDVLWFLENFVLPPGLLILWAMIFAVSVYAIVSYYQRVLDVKVWFVRKGCGYKEISAKESPQGTSISFKVDGKKLVKDTQGIPLSGKSGLRNKRIWICCEHKGLTEDAQQWFGGDIRTPARTIGPVIVDMATQIAKSTKRKLIDEILPLAMGGIGGAGFMAVAMIAMGFHTTTPIVAAHP